jgi:hypothetical protein
MRPLTLSNNFCEKVARISLRLRDASRAQGSRELGFRLAVGLDGSKDRIQIHIVRGGASHGVGHGIPT